jgi:hypothetical protein
VPIWELEFRCWDATSGRHVVLGREFEKLTAAGQERALHENAEIIASVARDLNFASPTCVRRARMPSGRPCRWNTIAKCWPVG